MITFLHQTLQHHEEDDAAAYPVDSDGLQLGDDHRGSGDIGGTEIENVKNVKL
jgi:hypothetical protein